MTAPLFLANLVAYSTQVLTVIIAGAVAMALLRGMPPTRR
jgi:hypothetical protein